MSLLIVGVDSAIHGSEANIDTYAGGLRLKNVQVAFTRKVTGIPFLLESFRTNLQVSVIPTYVGLGTERDHTMTCELSLEKSGCALVVPKSVNTALARFPKLATNPHFDELVIVVVACWTREPIPIVLVIISWSMASCRWFPPSTTHNLLMKEVKCHVCIMYAYTNKFVLVFWLLGALYGVYRHDL